jgi:hypothetical protein
MMKQGMIEGPCLARTVPPASVQGFQGPTITNDRVKEVPDGIIGFPAGLKAVEIEYLNIKA